MIAHQHFSGFPLLFYCNMWYVWNRRQQQLPHPSTAKPHHTQMIMRIVLNYYYCFVRFACLFALGCAGYVGYISSTVYVSNILESQTDPDIIVLSEICFKN